MGLARAREIVDHCRADKRIIPGIGHPIHKPVEPRVPRLFAIAAQNGFNGRYVELMKRIHARAEAASGRIMPINATVAIGALACSSDFRAQRARAWRARACDRVLISGSGFLHGTVACWHQGLLL